MRVCQTKLSSHFEVTVNCFSVVVSLCVIQCKHSAKETKSVKKSEKFAPNWSIQGC